MTKINQAILNLANTPADKRSGIAQVAAQGLARELSTLGIKGLTTQQVLQFLGSTGGKTLPVGSAGVVPIGSERRSPSISTGMKPLTIQQAKPLIQQAPNGTALETIKAQLVAAGMPANDAAQYIRDVKSGRK